MNRCATGDVAGGVDRRDGRAHPAVDDDASLVGLHADVGRGRADSRLGVLPTATTMASVVQRRSSRATVPDHDGAGFDPDDLDAGVDVDALVGEARWSTATSSGSSPAGSSLPAAARVTSMPRRRQAWASSTEIGPPPMNTSRAGTCSSSKIVSLVR